MYCSVYLKEGEKKVKFFALFFLRENHIMKLQFLLSILLFMQPEDLLLSSYNYNLPDKQIAQVPSVPAHNAKMLICTPNQNRGYDFQHKTFIELAEQLDDKYLIFLNRTKVFKARIPLHWVKIIRKSWKGYMITDWEIFVYRIISEKKFECLVSDSKNFRPWSRIFFENNIILESEAFTENWILFSINCESIFSFLEALGEMPLPPYIKYEKEKEQWYQTFFAEEIGSAAAPTASLHFTPLLVKKLQEQWVTLHYLCLHVGLGTFKPVYEEHIENQKLHFEPMIISKSIRGTIYTAKIEKKIFLPIWTTMIRYLESLPYIWKFLKKKAYLPEIPSQVAQWRDELCSKIPESLVDDFIPDQEIQYNEHQDLIIQTRLFIRPWIPFYLVDELITNFHLPKSSLMMLISAFMWRKNLLECYQEAINHDYKFYSFWDWMWVRG